MNPYLIIVAVASPVVIWGIFSKLRMPLVLVFSLLTGLLATGMTIFYGVGAGVEEQNALLQAIFCAIAAITSVVSFVRQLRYCQSGGNGLSGVFTIFFALFFTCLMTFLAMYAFFESKSLAFTCGYGIIALLTFAKAIHRQVAYSRA